MHLLLLAAVAAVVAAGEAAAGAKFGGRGYGDGRNTKAEDARLLGGTSWWYSWGLNPPAGDAGGTFDQEFVAMAWGAKQADAIASWVPHSSTKHLLGFNEPNLRHQSNLTAAQACAKWPLLRAAATKHGMALGSPAANHCKPGGNGSQDPNCFQVPTEWFDEFFALPGCGLDTIDFLTTHKYGCNATDTMLYIQELYARYHKPVWLTEFSCAAGAVPNQLRMMKEILPMFDGIQEVIPRYAWFAARAGHSSSKISANDALIAGDALTELGQFYNSSHSSLAVTPN